MDDDDTVDNDGQQSVMTVNTLCMCDCVCIYQHAYHKHDMEGYYHNIGHHYFTVVVNYCVCTVTYRHPQWTWTILPDHMIQGILGQQM